MVYQGYIKIPSNLSPVHMFDIYGPIFDSERLGEQNLTFFKEAAKGKLPEEEIAKRVANYEALQRGENWATVVNVKSKILDGLKEFLSGFEPDYATVLQEDCLAVMRDILSAGEEIGILTAKSGEYLRKVLPEDIGTRLGTIYGLTKDQTAFHTVYNNEAAKGKRFVSHTADELPELESAVASGYDLALIFINRNNHKTREAVTKAGIPYFVNDLREVPYTTLVQRE